MFLYIYAYIFVKLKIEIPPLKNINTYNYAVLWGFLDLQDYAIKIHILFLNWKRYKQIEQC